MAKRTAYVALLRAVNVGGHNSLPMATLKKVMTAHGAASVATYIQSGNVVFTHSLAEAKLSSQLAAAIEAEVGFAVPVVLRTAAEWATAIANNPYDEPYCTFLPAVPPKTALAGFDPKALPGEKFTLIGREVYMSLPGIGNSKLAAALSRALPGGTTRNWRTVQKLAAMLEALP
jgi:uncharacterized protein (DUF1697 family)